MFKVVDLFAGPGGLAEGFSALRDGGGNRVFEIALSVEKEASAFTTLRLRSFFRQFGGQAPDAYYDFLAGHLTREELTRWYPEEWAAACVETMQLELGTEEAEAIIDPILDALREDVGDRTVLVGGPPCQAYSLVGRARNRGNSSYVASEDSRHFLYREYIRILQKLRPAAFVMENVKGLLSAKVDGERIFHKVLGDLRSAGGGPDTYRIFPLSPVPGPLGQEHLIHAEKHGIPQARHRVILFGIRTDLAGDLGGLALAGRVLDAAPVRTTLADVLADMPPLRSGLSKEEDTPSAWQRTVVDAFRNAAEAAFTEECHLQDQVAMKLCEHARALEALDCLPPRQSGKLASVRDPVLSEWLVDPRLRFLPNHQSRSHMPADLARYAFAATFTSVHGTAPGAADFPAGLAPEHRNWKSGHFSDRFRVQAWGLPSSTVTSHISKDGHYFIHPDPRQCRSLTVREAARLQTFPDNYFFEGNRTQQYVQVGNAVPPLLAHQIAEVVSRALDDSLVQMPSSMVQLSRAAA